MPSADTLLRTLTELFADNQVIKSSAGNSYRINIPERLLDLNIKMRLKRFIFRFICVVGKWTRKGRQNILKLYTDRPYERLRFEV